MQSPPGRRAPEDLPLVNGTPQIFVGRPGKWLKNHGPQIKNIYNVGLFQSCLLLYKPY
jgi:hypothetical protein